MWFKTKWSSFSSEMPQLCPFLLPLQKSANLFIPHLKCCYNNNNNNNSNNNRCYLQTEAVNFVESDLHTTAQERGSLKGLLPVGTPTSRASLPAFSRQYCWSSAAAWDTWQHKHRHIYVCGTTFLSGSGFISIN